MHHCVCKPHHHRVTPACIKRSTIARKLHQSEFSSWTADHSSESVVELLDCWTSFLELQRHYPVTPAWSVASHAVNKTHDNRKRNIRAEIQSRYQSSQ
ncbi:hypothetical protein KC19_VG223400 [Ceratodon purpureus]|uniref:Uncharacterized protein n=1 Tax=Ceratodon purpureus TaxID=3225 RepID=A0A8T0HT55_CERPU|nr:hypothetical protein KC19_VG223400 [Ceratodon purpureus]